MRGRILVVEDEPSILKALRISLEAADFEVVQAMTGAEALDLAYEFSLDAVLLDLGLPGVSGLEVIERLRTTMTTPIIVISVQDDENMKVRALDAGADDYVTKPFGIAELFARLRAALRRLTNDIDVERRIETDHFTIDLEDQIVRVGETPASLTPIEWRIVEFLARNEGRLVSAAEILETVWGPAYISQTNYLRVHMAHVRRKLEPVPSQPRYFLTEPGRGIRFLRCRQV